ncbi:MAG: aminotransferase class III-fold pyridoxal phosphate-dependent enzyme, partial [Pseudomonadota bacterium]
CSGKIYQAIEQGSGFFQHGYTYIGHPAACAGSLAVVKAMHERDLINNVNVMGGKLRNALEAEFNQHPHIGDIRGRGLFLGLEIVKDRARKEVFDPSLQINKNVKKLAFESGLMCYPMGGTIDGRRGDHVLLAPPFIMEEQHIDEIVGKLSSAINTSLGA